MSNYSISSVDLSDFISNDPERKANFVKTLGEAYENVGFVAVKNHFLPDELTANLYQNVVSLFNLSSEIKYNYERPELAGQRGYTSFGKEHAKDHPVGDLKEFWQIGQEVEGNDSIKSEYPENVICTHIEGFNPTAMDAYKRLENTGRYMLRAIALYLGLDEFYFDDKIYNGNSILRAIHYGPITSDPKDAVRAAAHEDINLITLLMGASAEGLEILDKKGDWVGVTALPNQLVCNVGDMLQRLTNNKLKSTTHRVVNPPREKWGSSRYSIPFFLHPRSEMRLDCLPSCISDQNPLQYTPISAGEYLNERLVEIGLLKK